MKLEIKSLNIILLFVSLSTLSACGGGSGSGSGSEDPTLLTEQGKLIRSDNESLLEYFHESEQSQYDSYQNTFGYFIDVSVAAVAEGTDADTVGDSSVSSTNLQEEGVDEADLIKTDGRYLYSIDNSNFQTGDIVRIMDTQAEEGLTEIDSLSNPEQDEFWRIKGLYLHEEHNRLVALSSQFKENNDFNITFDYQYFSQELIDVLFMDIQDPSDVSLATTISFDGSLVDSRRNGDTLYLVLEDYTYYQYIDRESLLKTNLDDFLPSYTVDNSTEELITVANDCYIEEGQVASSKVVTMVAIDLSSDTPEINSQCFVGSTEAIYASQNALYLATTRSEYETDENGLITYRNREITTDIHKFAYEGLNFDYRGSGEVDGHLGWNQALKSFRFSEKDDYLRVVTYDVDQWSIRNDGVDEDNSPVLLSVLEENSSTKSLDLVSTLPNAQRTDPIGLPNEQLHASRFIGDRAYFVTFEITDPLYVIDLSDHTDPSIMGELKIDGYSDYLHPVSENLLVGIGLEGGVKLSLIDVFDPNNPVESDKIILGGLGTDTTVLDTHHGVTGLSTNDGTYRLAIPVTIREGFYDYVHTGLYRFNIDVTGQAFNMIDPLISHIADDSALYYNPDLRNNRSVIINDDVYYMHKGQFWMQDWGGATEAVGPK